MNVASGLAHLHATRIFPKGDEKIAIAHRDVKSSNILVRSDLTCCISDLGLAIALNPNELDKIAISGQAGSLCYMAPEALEANVNLNDVESFKQIDVFAMGLVIWEIFSRCEIPGNPNLTYSKHKLPFSDKINLNNVENYWSAITLIKEMHQSIEENLEIPQEWRNHTFFSKVLDTILSCLDRDPEARITANLVISRFTDLMTLTDNTTEQK